jgi:hypothetical protein
MQAHFFISLSWLVIGSSLQKLTIPKPRPCPPPDGEQAADSRKKLSKKYANKRGLIYRAISEEDILINALFVFRRGKVPRVRTDTIIRPGRFPAG